MVCLGNICRSPLAEAILKSKVDTTKVTVDSAGTSDYHIGEAPDKRSISTGKQYNLDLSEQRGRQFQVSDFDDFDRIFVMDKSNYRNVMLLARDENDRNKVSLILEQVYPNQEKDVPDPYFGEGEERFPEVYELLDQACEQIAKELS